MKHKKVFRRYIKYALVGVPSFLLDLTLLYCFIDLLHIRPFISAGIAFLIVETLSYGLNRTLVFPESQRDHHEGYIYFLMIAFVGVASVMGMMHIFVEVMHYNYFVTRTGIGFFTGIWSFFVNTYLNFKVGHHDH